MATKAKTKKPESSKKDVRASYNRFKEYAGKEYTGMAIGRSHKWNYDAGVWRDHKITPDLWSVSYSVTKRRAGHAPKNSGASVGTGYHWVMLVHQNVEKLNADDYSTAMTGLKFKLAHKRAGNEKWNVSAETQRKHLVNFLKQMIVQLEQEPIPLDIAIGDKSWQGEAMPVIGTLGEGRFHEFEIVLANKNLGIIRRLKSGWKLDIVENKKLIREIGRAIEAFEASEAE